MVWQPELFNILNLGLGISIKLGTSMYNVGGGISGDVATSKSALLVFIILLVKG